MKYELWQIVFDGATEVPLILLDSNCNFSTIYNKFLQISKDIPCAIFINSEK